MNPFMSLNVLRIYNRDRNCHKIPFQANNGDTLIKFPKFLNRIFRRTKMNGKGMNELSMATGVMAPALIFEFLFTVNITSQTDVYGLNYRGMMITL